MSGEYPTSGPEKPTGVTPTIVNTVRFKVTLLPTVDALSPKRLFQYP
jgi:hypothetical protein